MRCLNYTADRSKVLRENRPKPTPINAIALARSMSAKVWELRDHQSRQLLRQNRRREEARDVGRNLGWFGEGFDTADLRDAQAPERELVA